MHYTTKEPICLLEALAHLAPESSKNTLRGWLRDGRVAVDGTLQRKPALQLRRGQEITVASKQKKEGPLRILYEDAHLVVIDKPTGLLSVATDFETQRTAHAILKKRYYPKKVYVIHRLDQETSGVMCFALSEVAYHFLKAELAQHKVQRHYEGRVEGKLEGKGVWVAYLEEDKNYYMHSSQDPTRGERAVTHYEAIAYDPAKDQTRVAFQLETGKKNQIRVHAKDAGHPLVGDTKYGGSDAKRLYLHAKKLVFIHPITHKEVTVESVSGL